MGWFAPMLATLGAGSTTAAATAGTAAAASTAAAGTAAAGAGMTAGQMALAGLTVAAGVGAGVQTYQAGQAAKAQYKQQAKQEADAARQREIDRRRDLLTAIASQAAAAGTMGVSTRAGTGLAGIAQYDINESRRDMLTDRVNTGRSRNMLLKASKNAGTMGGLGAATSLLDTAVDLGRSGLR
jgi:hypothetical protein